MDYTDKLQELRTMVNNLDLTSTLVLQGVLLEHAMKLNGMSKTTPKKSVIQL